MEESSSDYSAVLCQHQNHPSHNRVSHVPNNSEKQMPLAHVRGRALRHGEFRQFRSSKLVTRVRTLSPTLHACSVAISYKWTLPSGRKKERLKTQKAN